MPRRPSLLCRKGERIFPPTIARIRPGRDASQRAAESVIVPLHLLPPEQPVLETSHKNSNDMVVGIIYSLILFSSKYHALELAVSRVFIIEAALRQQGCRGL